jgi:DNA gyrase subunit A
MTLMQTNFGFNMLAIVKGAPKVLSLKQILIYYLEHQEDVIRRRTEFDLKKAQARAHILEGLRIALDHIDEIIRIIRQSETSEIAKNQLMDNFGLSDKQAQAILDMRLVRLTGLEREKIESEYQDLLKSIADYKEILGSKERINQIIYEELMEIQRKFGDKRRTELMVGEVLSIEDEDLIEEEEVAVTLTHNGYIKRLPTTEFKSQHRGGRGIQGMDVHDDDFIEHLLTTSTHDVLLFFTNAGKVYRMKAYEIPEYGRTAKGIPVINLLGVNSGEKIQAVVNVTGDASASDNYLFFTTVNGVVKRTPVQEFANIRSNGLKAITLKDDDELIGVTITDGHQNVIIGTHDGYAVSFDETTVRSMGRTASGVRGIRLRDDDFVIGFDVLKPDSNVFIITEKGYGKQTPAADYPIKGRGGKGIKTANVTDKNGHLAGLTTVDGQEDIMVMTNQGVMIRFNIATVSQTGRATLGVRLIRLDDDGKVATMAKVDPEPEGDEPTDANATEGTTDDTAANETASVEETPAATPNDGTTGSEDSDSTDSSDDSAE